METVGRWTNKFLMFNLFLVFFFFAWLLVGLGGESLKINLGLNLWRQLWEPLIQHILGIVMAGAIASGEFVAAHESYGRNRPAEARE